MGQFKPTGTPTYVGNPSFPGMLFYGFDTGAGAYSIPLDCSPGHAYDPVAPNNGVSPCYSGSSCPNGFDPDISVMSWGSTTYGSAFQWVNTFLEPGQGSYVITQSPDALRTAVDLSNGVSGDTFIMFATFMPTAIPAGGSVPVIFGRGYSLDNSYFICAFAMEPTTGKILFLWNNNVPSTLNMCSVGGTCPANQSLASASGMSLNAIHTAIAVCWNASAPTGAVSVNLYLDGSLVGSTTGSNMYDVSNSISALEDQLQFGASFHAFGPGQSDAGFPGSIYQGGIATGNGVHSSWGATAAGSLATNPYLMLKP